MYRRAFLKAASSSALAAVAAPIHRGEPNRPPNIIVILADDLGYADLGCYGSRINTPNIDSMARDGALFQNFYSTSPVCSPSRAALMTGRYQTRVGMPSVLGPADTCGLPDGETTVAQVLKPLGYKTMCVGKWHLGRPPKYLPTNRGFDEYYGIPYSNDQQPSVLLHNTTLIEQPVQLDTITQRYTAQAVNFIRNSAGNPFFLYMPHAAPHIPLVASKQFRHTSKMGPYGDVVEEMDWSVGQVLETLRAENIEQDTLVVFTSDNGPFYQGSAGPLRGRKGDTFEGGMREPFIARFPRHIPAGKTLFGLATMMDVMPTVARLAGATLPCCPLDGVDIWPMMTGSQAEVERPAFLYFDGWNVQCARVGQWKLHMSRYDSASWSAVPASGRVNLPLHPPELYDLNVDPGESSDCSADYPDVVAGIQKQVNELLLGFPAEVRNAWNDTLRRPVYNNTSGAWPTPMP